MSSGTQAPLFCFAILSVWLTFPRMPLSREDEYGCRCSSHNMVESASLKVLSRKSQPMTSVFTPHWPLLLPRRVGNTIFSWAHGHPKYNQGFCYPGIKGEWIPNICQRCEFRQLTLKPSYNLMVSGPGTVFLAHFPSLVWGFFLFLAYAPGRRLWRCHSLVSHWGEAKHTMPTELLPLRGLPQESRGEAFDFQAGPKSEETLPTLGTDLQSHVLGFGSPNVQVVS